MPKMNEIQCKAFGALTGAYSFVTAREAGGDRSVTMDRYEKTVLGMGYDLDGFPRQKVENKRTSFIVHNKAGENSAELAVKFPKKEGNELRLYMADAQDFSGNSGDVFFIFMRSGDDIPHVGFMSPADWKQATEPAAPYSHNEIDTISDDAAYQAALQRPHPDLAKDGKEVTQTRIPRSIRAALEALKTANFKCEADAGHNTFTSAVTGENYVEAHHLMPMGQQSSYHYNLDVPANIVALCPTCHRKIHHASATEKEDLLTKIYVHRKKVLEEASLSYRLPDLFNAYGVTSSVEA